MRWLPVPYREIHTFFTCAMTINALIVGTMIIVLAL
jgi:hypothetical protein